MKTKHPLHQIEFGVVNSDDNIMFPFTFPYGFTLNIETYINYLEEVMLP